jgi:hypothetical protein
VAQDVYETLVDQHLLNDVSLADIKVRGSVALIFKTAIIIAT